MENSKTAENNTRSNFTAAPPNFLPPTAAPSNFIPPTFGTSSARWHSGERSGGAPDGGYQTGDSLDDSLSGGRVGVVRGPILPVPTTHLTVFVLGFTLGFTLL